MPKVIEPGDQKFDVSHERLIYEIEHASISRLPDILLAVLIQCSINPVYNDLDGYISNKLREIRAELKILVTLAEEQDAKSDGT